MVVATGTDVVDILTGRAEGFATALTWVPVSALRALTFNTGVEHEAEALEAVASALGVDLVFVPVQEPWIAEAFSLLATEGKGRGCIVDGVLGRLAEKIGWSELLRSSASTPGSLAIGLDACLHDALEALRDGLSASAEVVMIADELAGAAGWIVSPDFAFDALVPCYRRLVQECAGSAAATIFHSDGDVRALMPGLRRAGFDGMHFGSPGAASLDALFSAARSAGLTPMGGIEARALMRDGGRLVGEVAAQVAFGGPAIVCDDGGMTTAEDVAAYGVALETARRLLA